MLPDFRAGKSLITPVACQLVVPGPVRSGPLNEGERMMLAGDSFPCGRGSGAAGAVDPGVELSRLLEVRGCLRVIPPRTLRISSTS